MLALLLIHLMSEMKPDSFLPFSPHAITIITPTLSFFMPWIQDPQLYHLFSYLHQPLINLSWKQSALSQ